MRKSLFFLIPAALLFLFGGCLLFGSATQFLGLFCLAAGLTLVVFWLLFALKKRRPTAARRLLIGFTALLLLFALAFSATELWILRQAQTQDNTADYLIVLGAQVRGTTPSRALQDRLQAAVAYLQAHPNVQCVVSGGQGAGEDISEAQCMAQYLLAHGVSASRVWLETEAVNTRENIANSLALIERETGARPQSIAVLSSEYHLGRAKRIAASQGVTAYGVAAPTSLAYAKVNYFLRECFGVWYQLLFA